MAVWLLNIDIKDVWQDHDLSFPEMRARICKTLRDSGWLDFTHDSAGLDDVIYSLSQAESNYEFDYYWDQIYNYADYDRVWIGTF
jgi:hypothetical protein